MRGTRRGANLSQIVTLELKDDNTVLRGFLDDCEDNWNMHLTNVGQSRLSPSLFLSSLSRPPQISKTDKSGRVPSLDHAYIRGSQIRFIILPDMLKHAPLFRKKAPNPAQAAGNQRDDRRR